MWLISCYLALRKEWVACGLSGIFVLARNIIDSLLNIKCGSRNSSGNGVGSNNAYITGMYFYNH